jgi:hypothetical protein
MRANYMAPAAPAQARWPRDRPEVGEGHEAVTVSTGSSTSQTRRMVMRSLCEGDALNPTVSGSATAHESATAHINQPRPWLIYVAQRARHRPRAQPFPQPRLLLRPGPDSRRRACPDHWQVEATRQGRRAGGRYVLLLRRGRSAARHVSLLGLHAAAQQYLGQLRSVLSSEWLALALALGFQWQVATVTASLSAVCFRVFVSSLSYSVRVCVECLFSRSPGQAPYGANSACAKGRPPGPSPRSP